jgi:hypothetical protein
MSGEVLRSQPRARTVALFVALALIVGGLSSVNMSGAADSDTSPAKGTTGSEVIQPNSDSQSGQAAPQLSPAQYEAMKGKQQQMRERQAAQANAASQSNAKISAPAGDATTTVADASQFPPSPQVLTVGRNGKNTIANSAQGNTLAEPSAANNGNRVFAAGNTNYAAQSTDNGATFTNIGALPAGPAADPNPFGDQDVIVDNARRVTFHSSLYVNSGVTDGLVRIFVRRDAPAANCSYDIDPAPSGTALSDYPKLGLTTRFLYLTMNVVGSAGGFARIYRFNIDQMSDCVGTATNTFDQSFSTFGQRVWVPGGGTNGLTTMYWGQLDNATTFRIFRWAEASTAPVATTRTVSSTPFNNPDCRGGTNNTDFIGALNASIAGFQMRGTAAPGAAGGPGHLAFYWQAGTLGANSARPQGYIRGVVFSLSTLNLLNEPDVFSTASCFGFPIVTANQRGDIGITLAVGGKAGGGGTAAQGYVGIADEFTVTPGFFQTLALTASGNYNRSDGRYGDYATIHPHLPCELWFSATNYALSGGAAVANVNSRYVEFGRNQSIRCWRAHRLQTPAV